MTGHSDSSLSTDRGVTTVAFGYEYGVMAWLSAQTFKRHNPGLPVHVMTNLPWMAGLTTAVPGVVDLVDFTDAPDHHNRLYKTDVYRRSPFDRTLFIDADTFITGDLSPLFGFLERFDLAARILERPVTDHFLVRGGISDEVFWLDGGMLGFQRNERTEALFTGWHERMVTEPILRDMPYLCQSLMERADVRLFQLTRHWYRVMHDHPNDPPARVETYRRYENQLEVCDQLRTINRRIIDTMSSTFSGQELAAAHDLDRRLSWLTRRLLRPWLDHTPWGRKTKRRLGKRSRTFSTKLPRSGNFVPNT